MERKFGQVSEEVKQKIEEADSDTLLEWGEKIISASHHRRCFSLNCVC